MKKHLLSCTIIFCMLFACIPAYADYTNNLDLNHNLSSTNAHSMVDRMGNGVNMGNTLEPPYEGEWATAAREYYFDDYKAAGFKHVRIPIRWDNHASKQYPYTIDPAFMNRVEQVVDWSLSRGLITVINAHHDEWVMNDYNGNIQRLEMIWKQVAERFQNKSENLLFEVLNEPHGNILDEEINDMNSRIISMIRPSNPTRQIIIGAGHWNSWRATIYNLKLPNDPNLIATFHYYDPYDFTHQMVGSWGTEADQLPIFRAFEKVKKWSQKNNIPVYLGEYGARVENDRASRIKWYDYVSDVAVRNGFALAVWDDEGWFKLYDRSQRTFDQQLVQAILQPGQFTWPNPLPDIQEPNPQPPVYSVGTRLIDDFEGSLLWSKYQGSGANVSHSIVNGKVGKAMEIQFAGNEGGYWGVVRDIEPDWSSWVGISMDIKSDPQSIFNLVLTEKATDVVSDGENWKYTIRPSSTEWTTIVIPFSKFTKRVDHQPEGEDGNDILNLNKLKNLQVLQNGTNSGKILIDNIKLIGLPQ